MMQDLVFYETIKTEKSLMYAFRNGGRPGDENTPLVRLKIEKKAGEDGALFCKSCSNRITHRDQTISVSGSHTHTFFNPDGIVFELGCFRNAPGCLPTGEVTSQFTWFSGHAWCFALCRVCGVHLGWHYEMGESVFFGLILARLRE